MQQGDLDQPREFRALTWIEVHGPDGTTDGTPVLVNDGPSDLVTGMAGSVAAGRYRFTLTSAGQEYSDEHDCEGGTEDKPQRVNVTTPNQERNSYLHTEFSAPTWWLHALTWIEVHGPHSPHDHGTPVLINNGSSKFVTGMAGSIMPGRYRFTLTSGGQAYSDTKNCPVGRDRDHPEQIAVTKRI